jgi:hypothetical protein
MGGPEPSVEGSIPSSLTIMKKKCSMCGASFPNTLKYFYKRTKRGDLSGYCKKCNTVVKVAQNRKVKRLAVEYKGGKCIICGYSKDMCGFDFHHLDPSKKERKIAGSKNSSFEKIKPELDKCILVCAVCHREIHAGLHEKYKIIDTGA